jgi:branched-chain amino acid transport system ATP-binding protein
MILKIEELHTYYGNIHALKGISMEVSPGKIVALIGPNGAGKTTLLKSILGMVPPRNGHILFDGNPIQSLPTEQIVRSGISYVPEGRRIFPRSPWWRTWRWGPIFVQTGMKSPRTLRRSSNFSLS